MRKSIFVLGVVALVSACSTTQPQTPTPVTQVPTATAQSTPVYNPQMASVQRAMDSIPDWFTETPKSTDTIYSVGDGVSSSMSGALGNARANAFEGICQSAGGTVRSQTKIFRQDTESSSTSLSTTAIRNLCPDVDVTGAVVEKRKVIQDGARFRAFVLVSLPVGEKNTLARIKHADRLQEKATQSSEESFKELDRLVDRPQSKVETVDLLSVDNEEYKARRDATLQKPGAVIGQVTVR